MPCIGWKCQLLYCILEKETSDSIQYVYTSIHTYLGIGYSNTDNCGHVPERLREDFVYMTVWGHA